MVLCIEIGKTVEENNLKWELEINILFKFEMIFLTFMQSCK